jgi:hypothetical protein
MLACTVIVLKCERTKAGEGDDRGWMCSGA